MKTVLCRLPHGLVIQEGRQTVVLEYGINDGADVEIVERFLAKRRNLACVRDAQVCIVDDGRAYPPQPPVHRMRKTA